jgi:hypothetical protein
VAGGVSNHGSTAGELGSIAKPWIETSVRAGFSRGLLPEVSASNLLSSLRSMKLNMAVISAEERQISAFEHLQHAFCVAGSQALSNLAWDPRHTTWHSTLGTTYDSLQDEIKSLTPSGRRSVLVGNFRKIGYDAYNQEFQLVGAEATAMWFQKVVCDS